MCLASITKRYEKPSKKAVLAYKIVYKGTTQTPYRYFDLTQKYQVAEESLVSLDYINDGGTYIAGFHCYRTKEDAQKTLQIMWMDRDILPVYIRYITYEGTDGTCSKTAKNRIPNYIAKEIRLLTKKELERLNAKESTISIRSAESGREVPNQ